MYMVMTKSDALTEAVTALQNNDYIFGAWKTTPPIFELVECGPGFDEDEVIFNMKYGAYDRLDHTQEDVNAAHEAFEMASCFIQGYMACAKNNSPEV